MMAKDDFNKAKTTKISGKSKPPPPYSIRFSWEEREELNRLCKGQSWAGYIKDVIFVLRRRAVKTYSQLDRKLIAKLLGTLGKSRLASNLNQLAKAVNSGSLAVNTEVEKAILQACRTIEWMRTTLIKALGLKPYSSTRKNKNRDDTQR